MSNIKRQIYSLALTTCMSVAHAAVMCEGKVHSIALNPVGGTLTVNAGNGVHHLCNFATTQNGVNPETCKAWYSMFLTAKASGKTIRQYYERTDPNCGTIGNWAAPNPMPYYVELVD